MEAWKRERSKKQDFFSELLWSDLTETLSKLQSADSWIALLNAAKILKFQAILDLEPKLAKGEVPNIFYHCRWQYIFTLKDSFNHIQCTTKVGF